MREEYVIGVDVGTTGVKAVAVTRGGAVISEAEAEHHLSSPFPGWAEENPEDWWQNVLKTVGQVIRGVGRGARAIGVSGMVPALVLLDGRGEILRPSIQQNDARTAEELAWLRAALDEEAFFQETGQTINQQIVPPKLLWLRRHEPEIYRQIRWILGSYDFITHRLSGILSVEQNWALEAGFLRAEDRQWYLPMFQASGITPEYVPPVRQPHEIVGGSLADIEEATGLPRGTPVVAGSADHIAAALAAGLTRPGDLVLKFGGAGDALYCVDRFTPDRRLFLDYHDIPGLYVLNGCMAASGSLIKWFRDQFAKELSGLNDAYERLDREAADVPPGSGGLVVLPYFLGEKTPLFDPLARGVIAGLTLSHTRAHVFRAFLEAVVYGFAHHVEILKELGYPVGRVLVMDKGAQSPLWRQITSDVLGLPVYHLAGGHTGSAYGVAYVAGVAAGFWDWRHIEQIVSVRAVHEPDEAAHSTYRDLYRVYRELYPHLREDLHRLSIIQTAGR
jgi:xylulokinase